MIKRVACLACHVRGWFLFGGSVVFCKHAKDCVKSDVYIEVNK